METSEILKKVRQIEIKTRGLSNNIFAGQYHSAFKGRGVSFSEVREYQFGMVKLTIGKGQAVVDLPHNFLLDMFVGNLGSVKFTSEDIGELKGLLND